MKIIHIAFLTMKAQITKLKEFYNVSYKDLAEKIGITERQLYNVINGKCGKFLREKIDRMVRKIESL